MSLYGGYGNDPELQDPEKRIARHRRERGPGCGRDPSASLRPGGGTFIGRPEPRRSNGGDGSSATHQHGIHRRRRLPRAGKGLRPGDAGGERRRPGSGARPRGQQRFGTRAAGNRAASRLSRGRRKARGRRRGRGQEAEPRRVPVLDRKHHRGRQREPRGRTPAWKPRGSLRLEWFVAQLRQERRRHARDPRCRTISSVDRHPTMHT